MIPEHYHQEMTENASQNLELPFTVSWCWQLVYRDPVVKIWYPVGDCCWVGGLDPTAKTQKNPSNRILWEKMHPWSLTLNRKINLWKRRFLLENSIFRFNDPSIFSDHFPWKSNHHFLIGWYTSFTIFQRPGFIIIQKETHHFHNGGNDLLHPTNRVVG